ncbi:MAG: hypothetical protein MUP45_04095 [Candidatus Marinimicrobia bacterium]|nr:hypothetical protein [Candidatus Neomarinimicrobiota bacterium]
MARSEQETPRTEWPENFSPEIRRVLNQIQKHLAGRYEMEVAEHGVVFRLKNLRQLRVFPMKENIASVELSGHNTGRFNHSLYLNEAKASIVGKRKTVFFESESQETLIITPDFIITVTSTDLLD